MTEPEPGGREPLDVDVRRLRNALKRHRPGPVQPYGLRGVAIALHNSGGKVTGSVIVSEAPHPPDGADWLHASIAHSNGTPPSYADLCALKAGVFGDGRYAYQVFPPAAQHVNIHPGALHLWGRADGAPVLPEFGTFGTI